MDFTVEIDFNRNDAFDHSLSDVTSRVRDNFFFTSGWATGHTIEANVNAHIAPVNQMKLILDNADGELSFEKSGADFYALIQSGLQVRITVESGVNSHTFTYYTQSISEKPFAYGARTVTIVCTCAMPRFQLLEYEPDVEQDVLTSTAITNMFGTGDVILPYSSDYFIIGASSIDGPDLIFDVSEVTNFTDIETGYTTLEYVGDVLRSDQYDVPVQRAQLFAADVCMAEAFGRFFYEPRDNKFHFHSRYHDRLATSSLTLTADDILEGKVDLVSTPIYNKTSLHYTPREVGAANSSLFLSQQVPITLNAGSNRDIRVRYRDPNNENTTVSALVIDEPITGTDIVVEDTDSNDISNAIFRQADMSGGGGVLSFENDTDEAVTITKIEIKGTPIFAYQEQIAQAIDADSYHDYNLRPLPPVRANYIMNNDFAQSIADFLVRRHKDERRVFDSVSMIVTEDNFADVMAIEIGDVVTIQTSWSTHDTEYVVVGEFHQYDLRTGFYELRWYVRSNDTTPYFIIGSSSIGGPDLIGF